MAASTGPILDQSAITKEYLKKDLKQMKKLQKKQSQVESSAGISGYLSNWSSNFSAGEPKAFAFSNQLENSLQ